MADDDLFVLALQNYGKKKAASNPWYSAGTNLAAQRYDDPEGGFWENLASNAITGLAGGLMQGYGERSYEDDMAKQKQRLLEIQRLPYEEQVAQLGDDPDFADLALGVQFKENKRKQDIEDEKRKFLQDIAKVKATKTIEYDAQQPERDLANTKRIQDLEMGFTDDITKSPEFQNLSQMQAIIPSLEESLFIDTPAASEDFKYGVAKIFDPGSVVRDSEGKTVAAAGSLGERMLQQIDAATGGTGYLTPEIKKQWLDTVKQRVEGAYGQYETIVKPRVETLKTYGGKPENVLQIPLREQQRTAPMGGMASGLPPAAVPSISQPRGAIGGRKVPPPNAQEKAAGKAGFEAYKKRVRGF